MQRLNGFGFSSSAGSPWSCMHGWMLLTFAGEVSGVIATGGIRVAGEDCCEAEGEEGDEGEIHD